MEDLGGTAIQTYGADLRWKEREERPYQESCTWFIGGASQSFPGEEFIPKEALFIIAL